MKVLITGGHHTSAIPVIDELRKKIPGVLIYFIGHKYSMEGDLNPSAEFREIGALNIPFFDIRAGKFYRVKDLARLVRIPGGFIRAFFLLRRLKPDVVLSFGGYIAVPAALSAFVLGIPIVTHEQTVVSGYANRLVSLLAKKVLVTWESSLSYFPRNKAVFCGLPIRKEILHSGSNSFSFANGLPIIYITGGKQGSHAINLVVASSLGDLLSFCNVIHQCGSSSLHNDFEKLKLERSKLPRGISERYIVLDYVHGDRIGEVYGKSALVVARSGAHSVYELLTVKKPAILIPLPNSSHREQDKNAELFASFGLGKIIQQKDLTPGVFVSEVRKALMNLDKFSLNREFDPKLDCAGVIANETIKLVENSRN